MTETTKPVYGLVVQPEMATAKQITPFERQFMQPHMPSCSSCRLINILAGPGRCQLRLACHACHSAMRNMPYHVSSIMLTALRHCQLRLANLYILLGV